MQPAQRPTEHRVVRITARSAVVGVLVVVAAVVAQRVFVAAHRPLSWAAAAVVVAVLIDPIVDRLDRHLPRLLAVIVTLVVFGGTIFAVTYAAFDDLADGLDRLGQSAEDAAARLEARDDGVGDLARDVDASRRVELFVDTLHDRVTGGGDVLASTAGTAPTYLVGAILTLFLMSYGPRLAQSAVNQLPSARQREDVSSVVTTALNRSRRAVLLMLAEGLLVGLLVTGVARLLDVPSPAALGLAAGVLAMLPHVGIVLGNLPLILLLLALRSDLAAIIAAVVVVACQFGDSYVVRRRVSLHSVHIGLLVPWVVVLVGYAVYGVGGAAYGLAFAVFGLAVLDEIGLRRRAAEGQPGAQRDGEAEAAVEGWETEEAREAATEGQKAEQAAATEEQQAATERHEPQEAGEEAEEPATAAGVAAERPTHDHAAAEWDDRPAPAPGPSPDALGPAGRSAKTRS